MHPAGVVAFDKRQDSRSKVYAYEQKEISLSSEFEELFKANEKAWAFFVKQAPSYRKQAMNWVMTGKLIETRMSRLEKLIRASEEEQKI